MFIFAQIERHLGQMKDKREKDEQSAQEKSTEKIELGLRSAFVFKEGGS